MIQGEQWSADFKNEEPIFMPTIEMFVYKARHGGNKNDLVMARLNMIFRFPRYRCNGTRLRCRE